MILFLNISIHFLVVARPSLILGLEPEENSKSGTTTTYKTMGLPDGDQTRWKIPDPDRAKKQAMSDVGFSESLLRSVQLVTLQTLATPSLASKATNKPLWLTEWSVGPFMLPSCPEGFHDAYQRTIRAFLDPRSGVVLRVETEWPHPVPKMWDEVESDEAAKQMWNSGGEKYWSFPDEPPRVTFLAAVDAVQLGGGNPLIAKQVIGEHIIWSRMGYKFETPRSVWAITLRGVPQQPARGRSRGATQMKVSTTEQKIDKAMRYIVDAKTGELLCSTNVPHPHSHDN